jgi:hypothetical protein
LLAVPFCRLFKTLCFLPLPFRGAIHARWLVHISTCSIGKGAVSANHVISFYTPAAFPVAAQYCSAFWPKVLIQFVARDYSVNPEEIRQQPCAGHRKVRKCGYSAGFILNRILMLISQVFP